MQSVFSSFGLYIIQLRTNETVALAVVLLAEAIFQFWNAYRTVHKKDFVFLDGVRVISQYFPVLDFISYSCAIKRSWLSLWFGLAVAIFQFLNVFRTVRKKDFVFLAMVRVSSQYFLVSDFISYSCARKRSLLSLWLGLAVAIFKFWNVYRTVRKKYFVYLARIRVSSQYFPVFDCISYSCARKRSWLSLWLGLAVGRFPVLECISYSTQEGLRVSR